MLLRSGPAPVGNPEMPVRVPPGPMLKPETVLEPALATYRNFPRATTSASGCVPVGNGDAAIGVNAPVDVLIVKTETVFDEEFATKTTGVGPGVPDGVPVSRTRFEAPLPAPAQPENDASSTNETRTPNAQLIRFIVSLLV